MLRTLLNLIFNCFPRIFLNRGVKSRSWRSWCRELSACYSVINIIYGVKAIVTSLSYRNFIGLLVSIFAKGHNFFMLSHHPKKGNEQTYSRYQIETNTARHNSEYKRDNYECYGWNKTTKQKQKRPMQKATSFWRRFFLNYCDSHYISLFIKIWCDLKAVSIHQHSTSSLNYFLQQIRSKVHL
jgi:magnesium-transporting ATPase (P-type)